MLPCCAQRPIRVGRAAHMTDTPLELFLQAFDRLDADACARCSPSTAGFAT
jgi:hypothetical protein